MNRRGFLKGLAATAAGVLVAEDVLSSTSYFLPPSGGWTGGPCAYDLFDPGCLLDALPQLELRGWTKPLVSPMLGDLVDYCGALYRCVEIGQLDPAGKFSSIKLAPEKGFLLPRK